MNVAYGSLLLLIVSIEMKVKWKYDYNPGCCEPQLKQIVSLIYCKQLKSKNIIKPSPATRGRTRLFGFGPIFFVLQVVASSQITIKRMIKRNRDVVLGSIHRLLEEIFDFITFRAKLFYALRSSSNVIGRLLIFQLYLKIISYGALKN